MSTVSDRDPTTAQTGGRLAEEKGNGEQLRKYDLFRSQWPGSTGVLGRNFGSITHRTLRTISGSFRLATVPGIRNTSG